MRCTANMTTLSAQEVAALEWAIAETGSSVQDVILAILAPTSTPSALVVQRRPRNRPNVRYRRAIEFIETQIHVHAADLVATGYAPNLATARVILADGVARGDLVRTARGEYTHRSFLADEEA